MKRVFKIGLIVILILVPLVLIGITVARRLAQNGGDEENRPVPVLIDLPIRGRIERRILYPGNLVPKRTVGVGSQISGKVDRLVVGRGQAVEEGQILGYLEDESLSFRLEQAFSAWQAAEAQYEKASKGLREEEIQNARALVGEAERELELVRDNFGRTKNLYEKGAISKVKYEEVESALQTAETEVENAKRTLKLMEEGATAEELNIAKANASTMRAQYELVKLMAGYTEIKAPVDGIVADLLVDEGNRVAQGTPLLVIVQDDPILARVSIPEKYYGDVFQSLDILTVNVISRHSGGERISVAKVGNLDPTINAVTRTFSLELEIANRDGALRAGMYINAEIILESREEALLVPNSAVLSREAVRIVFILEDLDSPEEDNLFVARERRVTVGLDDDERVQILSGLGGEERIIKEGNAFLEDGQKVWVVDQQ